MSGSDHPDFKRVRHEYMDAIYDAAGMLELHAVKPDRLIINVEFGVLLSGLTPLATPCGEVGVVVDPRPLAPSWRFAFSSLQEAVRYRDLWGKGGGIKPEHTVRLQLLRAHALGFKERK